eukprot:1188606-Prorocentrum_minimum.AAC.3
MVCVPSSERPFSHAARRVLSLQPPPRCPAGGGCSSSGGAALRGSLRLSAHLREALCAAALVKGERLRPEHVPPPGGGDLVVRHVLQHLDARHPLDHLLEHQKIDGLRVLELVDQQLHERRQLHARVLARQVAAE